MDDLLSLPHMQTVHRRALRRLGRAETEEGAPEIDLDLVDALARELCADRSVPPLVRREVMRALVAPTPGGLQALGWLCRNESVDPSAVMSYAANLPLGESDPEALGERESLEAVESVLRGMEATRSGRMGVCVRLLASTLLSEAGRAAGLRRLVTGPWLTPGDRRTLVEWAVGIEVADEVAATFSHTVPPAPPGLARAALVCLVDQGDDLSAVVRSVIANLAAWADPRPLLQGLLDLVERSGSEMQPALRRQALDLCRRQKEALLRRRAYQLAARTESADFLKEALRDTDFGVRSWAMSRLNRPEGQN